MYMKSALISFLVGRARFMIVILAVCITPLFLYAQETDPTPDPEPQMPAPTPSPTLSNDGIFGCRGEGANISNVGTLVAIGGVYVPVNDAAVTRNTGYLVYKECVLDAVARKISESATAELVSQGSRAITTGYNGGPQFPADFTEEVDRRGNIITLNALDDANVGVICPAFKNSVRVASARTRVARQNQPNQAFTCTLPGTGSSYYERMAALTQQRNNPFGAQMILDAQIQATIDYDNYNLRQRLLANNGFYDQVDNFDDPLGARITTPGYLIAQSISQMVGSGFRQLENANEIDQVVSNFFGGLTTQLVSDTRGFTGLSQPVNGQPSYLDRMTAQTSANVRQQAANAALSVIGAARQIETAYRQAKEGIATALSDAIVKLRAAENQCWNLIVPAVQARAGSTALNIATSTQFSQQIIDSQIAPLATTTVRDIRASDAALATLNELIASVSNSSSATNQQQALLRLDTMVANRQLHTSTDATNAAATRDSVVAAINTLVDNTLQAWGDSTDPNTGWCNVNNDAVIDRWFNEWN